MKLALTTTLLFAASVSALAQASHPSLPQSSDDRLLTEIGNSTLIVQWPIAFEPNINVTTFSSGKMVTRNEAISFGPQCLVHIRTAFSESYSIPQGEKLKITGTHLESIPGYPGIGIAALNIEHSTVSKISCFNLVGGATTVRNLKEAFGPYLSIEGEAPAEPTPTPTFVPGPAPTLSPGPVPTLSPIPVPSLSPIPTPSLNPTPDAALKAFKKELKYHVMGYSTAVFHFLHGPLYAQVATEVITDIEYSKEYDRCLHKGFFRTKKSQRKNCEAVLQRIENIPALLDRNTEIKILLGAIQDRQGELTQYVAGLSNPNWKQFAQSIARAAIMQAAHRLAEVRESTIRRQDELERQCVARKIQDATACRLQSTQNFYQAWVPAEFAKSRTAIAQDTQRLISEIEKY